MLKYKHLKLEQEKIERAKNILKPFFFHSRGERQGANLGLRAEGRRQ
jgi:hypothetical protein